MVQLLSLFSNDLNSLWAALLAKHLLRVDIWNTTQPIQHIKDVWFRYSSWKWNMLNMKKKCVCVYILYYIYILLYYILFYYIIYICMYVYIYIIYNTTKKTKQKRSVHWMSQQCHQRTTAGTNCLRHFFKHRSMTIPNGRLWTWIYRDIPWYTVIYDIPL